MRINTFKTTIIHICKWVYNKYERKVTWKATTWKKKQTMRDVFKLGGGGRKVVLREASYPGHILVDGMQICFDLLFQHVLLVLIVLLFSEIKSFSFTSQHKLIWYPLWRFTFCPPTAIHNLLRRYSWLLLACTTNSECGLQNWSWNVWKTNHFNQHHGGSFL